MEKSMACVLLESFADKIAVKRNEKNKLSMILQESAHELSLPEVPSRSRQ